MKMRAHRRAVHRPPGCRSPNARHIVKTACLCGLLVASTALYAADRSDLRVVRSLAAEAAATISLKQNHRVSATYARIMEKSLRQNLVSETKDASAGEAKKFAQLAIQALDAENREQLLRVVAATSKSLGP